MDIDSKNLLDSKITDRNIPIVISIAIEEQHNKKYSIIFSRWSLALKLCLILIKVTKAVNKNIIIEMVNK